MPQSKNNNYLDHYTDGGIYSTIGYASPVVSIGIYAALHIARELKRGDKVLCVGCGNGYEVVTFLLSGMDAYGTELHIIRDVPVLKNRIIKAISPNLPFRDKEFKLVQCCEVLEHIPEELTIPFMKECLRVSEMAIFTAALINDPPWNTHINLHKPQWWMDILDELPCRVIQFQHNIVFENNLGEVMCSRYTPNKVFLHVSQDIHQYRQGRSQLGTMEIRHRYTR